MKKSTKPLALLTAGVLLAMSACGGTAPAPTVTNKPAATAATATEAPVTATEAPAPAAPDIAATDPLPEVTLSFIFFDATQQATDEVWNAISEQYKDQLNAKFDVQFIAGSDYKDRILVKQAAGDKWDLNFEGEWLSYFQMANLNAYMPLDDLLPVYAPTLYNVYQESGVLNAAKSKVPAIPASSTTIIVSGPICFFHHPNGSSICWLSVV